MENLTQMRCEACSDDAPRLTETEMADLRSQIPDWEVVQVDGIPRLQRVFSFRDFARALAFTDAVGAAAEAEDHHPALLTEWGKTTVSWWTHKVGGLHRNDFIMAAKTDDLYRSAG
jgi:4a-hydroxytetrahydrobiopterin dehydratase